MLRDNHSKNDQIKSAIYNPKEFRGNRVGNGGAWPAKAVINPSSSYKHFPIFFWLSVIALVIYFWTEYNHTPTVPIPNSGVVQLHYNQPPDAIYAPLRLVAHRSNFHYLLKLEDWNTGVPVLAVFVRSGDQANVQVPIGIYRAKYAYGYKWYGFRYFFGKRTEVVQVKQPLIFALRHNQVTGLTIDFNLKVTGNLQTAKADRSSF